MAKDFDKITIALAGIFQSAALVKDFSINKIIDEQAFSTAIHSIFQQNPSDIVDVYGDLNGLSLGLKNLHRLYHVKFEFEEQELSRYLVALMHLQKILQREKITLDSLGHKIQHIAPKLEYYPKDDPIIIADLAKAYADTVSTLDYRIHIQSESEFLRLPENMQKLRVMLLAGLRSAILWQQVGGNRWQLFFSRKKIITTAEKLLERHSHDLH